MKQRELEREKNKEYDEDILRIYAGNANDDDLQIIQQTMIQGKVPLPTTLTQLGDVSLSIVITTLNDVYDTTQQCINDAFTELARQQFIDKQLVVFQIISEKTPLERLRISDTITVNHVVFELTQIINYNCSSHYTTRFWLSDIEATFLGDASLAGTYFLDALDNGTYRTQNKINFCY